MGCSGVALYTREGLHHDQRVLETACAAAFNTAAAIVRRPAALLSPVTSAPHRPQRFLRSKSTSHSIPVSCYPSPHTRLPTSHPLVVERSPPRGCLTATPATPVLPGLEDSTCLASGLAHCCL
ncbi:hypothetical protein E2C01_083544 [Portunus trituberculatus]|uniref:Uncharacterized protein n=1 Tax=Portunus trituberculatus TaxID=210409 RepID=A0A5B7J564_PORTR|nr:hypothetical protein [Portunus trituberculatus]